MADRLKFDAELRTLTGKKVKQLRRVGITPGVVYGASDAVSVQLETAPLFLYLRDAGSNDLLDLNIDGDVRTVITKDVQRHVTRGELVHVDFFEVNMKETIIVDIDVNLIGESPVPTAEGIVQQVLFQVTVEALPDKLISSIDVDAALIDSMDATIFVSDLEMPEGVTSLSEPETAIATFSRTSAAMSAGVDEEVAEGEEGAEGAEGAEGEAAAE